MTEIRKREYPVQVHNYCDKCAIWIEPDDPAQKIPGFTYVTRAEMDAARGFIESDAVDKYYSKEEILSIIRTYHNINHVEEFFEKESDKTKATVKFFGEMTFQGYTFQAHNKDTGQNTTDYAYKCNNPACKGETGTPFEIMVGKQYPSTEIVEGRVARNPQELSQEDRVINAKMKAHVGSSVLPDTEVAK